MNAEQYLNVALGGNMNLGTLKPLAWHEIMEGYARHKLAEAQPQADNSQSDAIALWREVIPVYWHNVHLYDWFRDNMKRINAVLAQQHT